jgi:hypothetical protein
MLRGRFRRLALARRMCALGAVVAAAGACAGGGGEGGFGGGGGVPAGGARDVPRIGLERGGHWSVLTVRPPHLSGPLFHLQLKDSVLSGAISGGAAPAGTLRVTIKRDGAEGFGPLGPVSLDYDMDEARTEVGGTWNGGRVHLVFAQDSLKGTVAANSGFYGRSNAAGLGNMESFRSPRTRAFGRAADQIEPLPQDMSCEYYLDKLTPDGALNGGSICAGMPQQTRLEVPAVARAWMTHAELVTVLVAVLSAPPVVRAEQDGPRFDGPTRRR